MAQIGSLVEYSLSPEATAGTYVAPVSGEWLENAGGEFDSVKEDVELTASAGDISAIRKRALATEMGQGSIVTPIGTVTIGTILGGLFGSYDASPTGAGPYTHSYTIQNDNDHQSFSINLVDPEGTQRVYTNQLMDTFEIEAEAGGEFVLATMEFLGDKESTESTETPAYATQDYYTPDQVTVEIQTAAGSLTGTGNTNVESLSLSVEKNVDARPKLGATNMYSVHNQRITVTGSLTTELSGDTDRAFALTDGTKAMNIILTSGTNVITLTLGELSFESPTVTKDLDGISMLERPFVMHDVTSNFSATLVNDTALYPLT